jgi:hypothetical protein
VSEFSGTVLRKITTQMKSSCGRSSHLSLKFHHHLLKESIVMTVGFPLGQVRKAVIAVGKVPRGGYIRSHASGES